MNEKSLCVPTEDEEQESLFRWATFASAKYPFLKRLVHIPNEGKRSKSYGAKLKRMGLMKGVPDIFLPLMSGGKGGLFIELKRTKGGKVSTEQEMCISMLNSAGYVAKVCRGWTEAADAICEYAGIDNKIKFEL